MRSRGVRQECRACDTMLLMETHRSAHGIPRNPGVLHAVTCALNGRVAQNPAKTRRFHRVMVAVCETVHRTILHGHGRCFEPSNPEAPRIGHFFRRRTRIYRAKVCLSSPAVRALRDRHADKRRESPALRASPTPDLPARRLDLRSDPRAEAAAGPAARARRAGPG
jgi:hypothetical protein